MQIYVKSGAVEHRQMIKKVAKPDALQTMQKIERSERTKATDPWFRGRVDQSEAAKNARFYEKNIEKVIHETLAPAVKDRMWKRAKELKDKFIVGMLSKEELHPVRGFMKDGKQQWVIDEEKMRSLQSVERNSKWYNANQHIIREFKNIMRHLDPLDPNAGDIERFRPKKKNLN